MAVSELRFQFFSHVEHFGEGFIRIFAACEEDSETAIAVVTDNRRISLKWNQAVNSGEWNEIGLVDLSPGSVLELDVKASRGMVVADAFAIVESDRTEAGHCGVRPM